LYTLARHSTVEYRSGRRSSSSSSSSDHSTDAARALLQPAGPVVHTGSTEPQFISAHARRWCDNNDSDCQTLNTVIAIISSGEQVSADLLRIFILKTAQTLHGCNGKLVGKCAVFGPPSTAAIPA